MSTKITRPRNHRSLSMRKRSKSVIHVRIRPSKNHPSNLFSNNSMDWIDNRHRKRKSFTRESSKSTSKTNSQIIPINKDNRKYSFERSQPTATTENRNINNQIDAQIDNSWANPMDYNKKLQKKKKYSRQRLRISLLIGLILILITVVILTVFLTQSKKSPANFNCSISSTTTLAPINQINISVLYTFDNTSNDYYGNYNAVPINNPQYVSPGYNGRGAAIQLISNKSQCLTIANPMNFYQRSFTVEAWIYPFQIFLSSDAMIYGQYYASIIGYLMWFFLRSGYGYGAFFNDDVHGLTVYQSNQWQHIAFTYNYTTLTQTIYHNIHTNASPCLITVGTQTIGCYPNLLTGFFVGYIDQLAFLFDRAKSSDEILADATLVAYYTMDCTNLDSGPNQIDSLANDLSPGDGGTFGQSFLFNIHSSYFQVTGLVLLGQSYSSYSFSLWLRPMTSLTNGGTILHLSQYTNGTGWCAQMIGFSSLGQIIVNGVNSSGLVSVIGPVLSVNQWIHIAKTYSQTNGVRLYVNGTLHGQSNPFIYAASGVPMTVTLGQPLNGDYCNHSLILSGNYRGQMDEFYIFSRELSQSDVTSLANA